MRLSAPKFVVFLLAMIVAVAAIAVQYFGANVPFVGQHSFAVLLAAFGLLTLGNLDRGV